MPTGLLVSIKLKAPWSIAQKNLRAFENLDLVHRFHEIDRVGLPVISYESCLSCGQHSDLSGPSI
jgi:hypothetical protein